MGKISVMSTLVAHIQAIPTKKQYQKEVRNDNQLKPNLIIFSGLFESMWPVTESMSYYSSCHSYNSHWAWDK